MKVLFFVVVYLICASFGKKDKDEDDKLKKAKDAKKEYKKGDGLKRMKDKVQKENTMGLTFTWIRDEKICLQRKSEYGKQKAERDCYALDDFDIPQKDMTRAIYLYMIPYQKHPDITEKWYERLYNSVAKILLSESEKESPISLGKGGGAGAKKRYNVPFIGIGDGKTFMKSTITKGQIGPTIKLRPEEALQNVEGAVDKVLDMILEAYEADLKKGVDLQSGLNFWVG